MDVPYVIGAMCSGTIRGRINEAFKHVMFAISGMLQLEHLAARWRAPSVIATQKVLVILVS
jgi:hypothetical protein